MSIINSVKFIYDKYQSTKNFPYMEKGEIIDIVKYVDWFTSNNDNFEYNDVNINVSNVIDCSNGIFLLETDLIIDIDELSKNAIFSLPTDSKAYNPYTRKCERGIIRSNSLAQSIFKILPNITISENNFKYTSICCSSYIRYIKYLFCGDKFKTHRDGYFVDKNNNDVKTFYTFIIFLNTPEDGGETFFDLLNIKIKPKIGNILIFPHAEVHCGLKLISGTKHILRGDIVFNKC